MSNHSCKIHGYFNSTVIKGDVPCPWCERDIAFTEARRAHDELMNLQPHIAQLPEKYRPFIDSHVDIAMEILAAISGAHSE